MLNYWRCTYETTKCRSFQYLNLTLCSLTRLKIYNVRMGWGINYHCVPVCKREKFAQICSPTLWNTKKVTTEKAKMPEKMMSHTMSLKLLKNIARCPGLQRESAITVHYTTVTWAFHKNDLRHSVSDGKAQNLLFLKFRKAADKQRQVVRRRNYRRRNWLKKTNFLRKFKNEFVTVFKLIFTPNKMQKQLTTWEKNFVKSNYNST